MSWEGTVSRVGLRLMFLRRERGRQAANIPSGLGTAPSALGAERCGPGTEAFSASLPKLLTPLPSLAARFAWINISGVCDLPLGSSLALRRSLDSVTLE